MHVVVVGGGIAGVICARRLRELDQDVAITLVCAGRHVKTVHNWIRVGQFTELFDVREEGLTFEGERIDIKRETVIGWSYPDKTLTLSDGSQLKFDKLVIATGALPKKPVDHPLLLTVRDTDTAKILSERLSGVEKVAIVGNGGIATELVYELHNVDVTWCIKDDHVSAVYFDQSTSEFLTEKVQQGRLRGSKTEGILHRWRYGDSDDGVKFHDEKADQPGSSTTTGCALGPDWSTVVPLSGKAKGHNVRVMPSVLVNDVSFPEAGGVTLNLSSGEEVHIDVVIWATGVKPNTELWNRDCEQLELAEDGGILVDNFMKSSLDDVYACGDVCTVQWPTSTHWTQMRTWTQARQTGDYTARCVLNIAQEPDFFFELFTHCTSFYGYKVILIGDYKAARQPPGWYFVERVVDDDHVVRCVMFNHRVQGAILIGETDLEETLENLILNQTDMTNIEADFLDPSIDIEDYFD